MRELFVKLAHKTYPILIENNLFQRAGEVIRGIFPGRKVFIVTDSNLASVYGSVLVEQLEKLNIQAGLYTYPAGETSKNHEQLLKMYEAFSQAEITRKDVVVALGGGVTGDMTGFAASTWLRGTGFVQIPTSLLAMVDSSIGGKVAVNLPVGKNLVEHSIIRGSADRSFDAEHPARRAFRRWNGRSDQAWCIRDNEMFDWLDTLGGRKGFMEHAEELICRNCDIKRQVVQQDERETGLRMLLNFGHTFGHAIEKVFIIEVYHGEAVAIEWCLHQLSCKLGYCHERCAENRALVTRYQLINNWPKVDREIKITVLLISTDQ